MLKSTAYGRGDEVAMITLLEQNVFSRERRYTFGLIVIIAGNRRGYRPWLGWRTLVQLNLSLRVQKTPGVVEQYLTLLLEKQKFRRTYGTKQGPNSFSTYRIPGSWEIQFL